jgi:NADPH2:quinone reductase
MKKAACLFINPLTAISFLDIMKKKSLNSLIHTSGASAVGKILTKLCAKNNIKIINTVRRWV